jgi:DNA-binding MarR family transcriptional regulator
VSPRAVRRARRSEDLSPVDALAQLSFLIQSLIERRATADGLSVVQIRLLGVLRDREPTMQELSKLLGLDKSSTSGLVDRAQRRGLVQRIPSTVDRRVVTVRLTDASRALVASVRSGFEADITDLLGSLDQAERDRLAGAAARVVVAYAAARGVDLAAGMSAPD